MNIAYGVTWGERKRPRLFVAWATAMVLALVGMSLTVPQREAMVDGAGRLVSVIVQELPGSGNGPEKAVEAAGGQIGRELSIINGFSATVPSGALARLETTEGVRAVTLNGKVRLLNWGNYNPNSEEGSLMNIAKVVQASEYWKRGITGQGVDVALIDSGVVPVDGLMTPNKVVNGPDLSFEGQFPEVRYLDTYGHGTHMAGIIAGKSNTTTSDLNSLTSNMSYAGIAPDARIVNVKVAANDGATDVSQVIAAIDWVVQHRNDDGMNIKVLNLSFGTDGTQSYLVDPLTYATEVAWRKGITVVVAAGNEGYGSPKLNNPAYDPFVIAVGADHTMGNVNVNNDVIPDFSSTGDGSRNPDLVAPGKSVASLRAPGSFIDELYPSARRSDGHLFLGSGTSQAAAVVSGAAALIAQERPGITPDQIKYIMKSTAAKLPAAHPIAQGAGLLDLKAAGSAATPSALLAAQPYAPATGTGSLELARGSAHVVDEDGTELTGEQTIFGDAWDGRTWSGRTWSGTAWTGGDWLGRTWSGDGWNGTSWAGRTWSGRTWSGNTWSGRTWSGRTWSGRTWSGNTWSGNTWSGRTWSGITWSGRTWSSEVWSGRTWSGAGWN